MRDFILPAWRCVQGVNPDALLHSWKLKKPRLWLGLLLRKVRTHTYVHPVRCLYFSHFAALCSLRIWALWNNDKRFYIIFPIGVVCIWIPGIIAMYSTVLEARCKHYFCHNLYLTFETTHTTSRWRSTISWILRLLHAKFEIVPCVGLGISPRLRRQYVAIPFNYTKN